MSDSDSDDDVPLGQLAAKLAPVPAPAFAPAPAPAPKPEPKPAAKADSSDDEDVPISQKKRAAEPVAKVEVKKPKAAPVALSKPAAKIEPPSASSSSKLSNGAPKPAVKPAAPKRTIEESEDESASSSSEDELPISQKKKASASPAIAAKPKGSPAPKKKPKPEESESSDDDADFAAKKTGAPAADGAKWYEDGGTNDWKRGGQKWRTLEHAGVLFPPLYVPHRAVFKYDGEVTPLTGEQEEVCSMFAAMLSTDYAKNEVFQANFMKSWRPLLKKTEAGKKVKHLEKCDFSAVAAHIESERQAKKESTADQKKAAKAERDEFEKPYIFANVDDVKEKVGNFRVEPPGLFRGRGAHPKMGQLKARIWPEDITLNLGKRAKVPAVPDIGDGQVHKWGEIVHKNTVTWLAKWKDSINGEDKCVWLAANSSWKGQSDLAKYEKARELKKHIGQVRSDYTEGMRASGNLEAQQKSVAVYLIDRLALRVGGEKNTDEEADTVGCCSLRVEHVVDDAGENKLHLNFLGKDSIVYDNTTEILPRVYVLIHQFMKGKKPDQQLFDQVVPDDLNEYFKSVMPGLSAKVFRTYNASITLCSELAKTSELVTDQQKAKEGAVIALCNYYTIANKNVAELCNHQKAASASHGASIEKMDAGIEKLRAELKEAKKAKSAKVEAIDTRLAKAIAARDTKEETKCVSLGTSKINYNDPRITTAWCKRFEVPIQKQFPKTLLAKFAWAMSVEPGYKF